MTHTKCSLRILQPRNYKLHAIIFHPVILKSIHEQNSFVHYINMTKTIKHRLCLSSYPAGRGLWFRIFEENQTVPDQHDPGWTPVFPVTQQTRVCSSAQQITHAYIHYIHKNRCNLIQLFFLSLMGAASPQFPASFCNFCLVQETSFLQLLRAQRQGLKGIKICCILTNIHTNKNIWGQV